MMWNGTLEIPYFDGTIKKIMLRGNSNPAPSVPMLSEQFNTFVFTNFFFKQML